MKLGYFLAIGIVGIVAATACSSSTTPASTGTGASGGSDTGSTSSGTGGEGTGGSHGTKTCNDLLAGDPASSSWSTSDPTSDFTSMGASAYEALNTCACEDSTPSGCKNVCTTGLNGTSTPNFCDSGKTPNQNTGATSCYGCLMTTCGTQVADCKSN